MNNVYSKIVLAGLGSQGKTGKVFENPLVFQRIKDDFDQLSPPQNLHLFIPSLWFSMNAEQARDWPRINAKSESMAVQQEFFTSMLAVFLQRRDSRKISIGRTV